MFRFDESVAGKTAVVTGASQGIGRGVAQEFLRQGARVFATVRAPSAERQNGLTTILCDHRDDAQVRATFDQIEREAGAVDILVNSVWGGYERMMENGEFTWLKPFWEQPLWRWDAMFTAGVRAHFLSTQLVAPGMIARGRGLIVNISHWAAQKRIGNVPYGVAKAATDKMTSDMAVELRPHGVAVVCL